jgi:hypothetical protein
MEDRHLTKHSSASCNVMFKIINYVISGLVLLCHLHVLSIRRFHFFDHVLFCFCLIKSFPAIFREVWIKARNTTTGKANTLSLQEQKEANIDGTLTD